MASPVVEPELSQAAADLEAAKFSIRYHAWIGTDIREPKRNSGAARP
jgi:hypothetical protein